MSTLTVQGYTYIYSVLNRIGVQQDYKKHAWKKLKKIAFDEKSL